MPTKPSLLVVAAGTRAAASTRHRLWNYRDALERDFAPLRWIEYGGPEGWSPAAVCKRVACMVGAWQGASSSDVVLIQKLLFPGAVVHAWKSLGARIVYDLDDALYAPAPTGEAPAAAAARRRRLDDTLQLADQVVVGSEPLRRYASQRNSSVTVVYPSLDSRRFRDFPGPQRAPSEAFRVGWIGHDRNLHYLAPLAGALASVAEEVPGFQLVVCSSKAPSLPPLPPDRIAFVPWSEENELRALASMDAAVSPMGRDAWSQGRGGRVSVLNSMAAGLPVVLEIGGGVEELIRDGESALVADSPADFRTHLLALAQDPAYGRRVGAAARAVVEQRVWSHVQYPRLRAAVAGKPAWTTHSQGSPHARASTDTRRSPHTRANVHARGPRN